MKKVLMLCMLMLSSSDSLFADGPPGHPNDELVRFIDTMQNIVCRQQSLLTAEQWKREREHVFDFLRQCVDPNVKGRINGATALHLAAQNGDIELVRMLIKHGASVDALNDFGRSPRYYALEGQHTEIANLLIQEGASLTTSFENSMLTYKLSQGFVGFGAGIPLPLVFSPLQQALDRSLVVDPTLTPGYSYWSCI